MTSWSQTLSRLSNCIVWYVKLQTTDTETWSLFLAPLTQTSAFDEYGMSWHISGAKQHGVPTNVDALSIVAVIRFAMPKSPTSNRHHLDCTSSGHSFARVHPYAVYVTNSKRSSTNLLLELCGASPHTFPHTSNSAGFSMTSWFT